MLTILGAISAPIAMDRVMGHHMLWSTASIGMGIKVALPTGMATAVLVVEDDASVREMMAAFLGLEGFRPVTAANGREALTYLKNGGEAGVILLDLMMPVMTGFDFRREQQRDPRLAAIPVIVISANAGDETADFQPAAAFRKPIELDEVISMVRLLLAKPQIWHS